MSQKITPIEDAALEVRAIMLNINSGQNERIMEACRPLCDYSKFISYVKMNQKKGFSVREAVDLAVERAIEEDLLDGYFTEHKAEVIGMILTEYDEEFVHEGWYQDGLEEGIKRGREEGREEGLGEGIRKGREEGIERGREEGLGEGIRKGREETMQAIAGILGYTPEEFVALLAEKESNQSRR